MTWIFAFIVGLCTFVAYYIGKKEGRKESIQEDDYCSDSDRCTDIFASEELAPAEHIYDNNIIINGITFKIIDGEFIGRKGIGLYNALTFTTDDLTWFTEQFERQSAMVTSKTVTKKDIVFDVTIEGSNNCIKNCLIKSIEDNKITITFDYFV